MTGKEGKFPLYLDSPHPYVTFTSGHNQEDVGKYFTTPFGAGGAGQPWFVAFDSCGVNTPTAVCLALSI